MMEQRIITEIAPRKNPFYIPVKLRVCAYVRVSTDHTGQLNSLQNQTEYYERKLQSNPAYEYCGVFPDAGISGAKEERPGFQAMMEKARAEEIDLIITKSISRFARNTLLLLQCVRELREIGVGIIFEEQNINTLNAEGELMLTVLAAIAEEERKSVRSNVQWAMQNKFKRGEIMVDANRLLGYDRDENGNLIINQEQAKIVKRIYKRFLEGVSGYKIAQELNEQNVPTFTDKPWSSDRILRSISNEKYAGNGLMQKTYVNDEGREVINRGQKAQYYIENAHPAIISARDWEQAQRIRAGRKNKLYSFTSMLRCPYCGASLIRVIHQRRWVAWKCATYMQKGKAVCPGVSISDGILQEIARENLITKPMVVEEVNYAQSAKKRSQKDFRLIPAAQYEFRQK